MPDQRPNNAPDTITRKPPLNSRVDALSETSGDSPGGGGLGGQSAAEAAPRSGDAGGDELTDTIAGGADGVEERKAMHDSVREASDKAATTPHPSSR
jgi:hypothetical protein